LELYNLVGLSIRIYGSVARKKETSSRTSYWMNVSRYYSNLSLTSSETDEMSIN
jgi:peptide subunit release factor RF-3